MAVLCADVLTLEASESALIPRTHILGGGGCGIPNVYMYATGNALAHNRLNV